VKKYHFWLITFILIALALRLYNLTYHSLWFDEAISVHWAKQGVPRILEVGFTLVEDRLPPLYYLMLKGWTTLFGFGEASVRSLSVAFGVLLVPVTAGITALLFNRRIALVTAALVTLNPFLIWYSQEARMYAPVTFFSTLSVWTLLQACRSASGQWQMAGSRSLIFFLLFTLSATAGLYSHLYTGFLLPALGLWLIIGYPRAWRIWLLFAGSALIITLIYAPILLAIWRFSSEAAPGDPLTGILQRAWWLLQAFTIWKASLTPLRSIISITITLFAILAYLKPKTNQPQNQNPKSPLPPPLSSLSVPPSRLSSPLSSIPHPLLLTTLLLIFPFVIANVLLFRNHLAFFGARYFIVMVPWFLIIAAIGADNLGKWVNHVSHFTSHISRLPLLSKVEGTSQATFIILLILTALPIPGQWSISAAKEMWRQSVALLAEKAAPNHAILIHPDWVRFPFQYYFQGPGQTYAAFGNITADTALDGPLQGIVGDHQVIWLIQSHLDAPDPDQLVEQWLATRYPLVTELYPPGIVLKGYAPGYQLETLPPEATPVDFEFKNGLRLIGYQADSTVSATDELFHPPSGWVHVTLYWLAGQPINIEVAPFVHLVGPEGVWGVSLNRPGDALKRFPPSRWPVPSPIIRHDLDINLNPDTPPGTYQLMVGLHGYKTQYSLSSVELHQ
jgi:uncharacterized membrane protein